jgi:hypothetical protein
MSSTYATGASRTTLAGIVPSVRGGAALTGTLGGAAEVGGAALGGAADVGGGGLAAFGKVGGAAFGGVKALGAPPETGVAAGGGTALGGGGTAWSIVNECKCERAWYSPCCACASRYAVGYASFDAVQAGYAACVRFFTAFRCMYGNSCFVQLRGCVLRGYLGAVVIFLCTSVILKFL